MVRRRVLEQERRLDRARRPIANADDTFRAKILRGASVGKIGKKMDR